MGTDIFAMQHVGRHDHERRLLLVGPCRHLRRQPPRWPIHHDNRSLDRGNRTVILAFIMDAVGHHQIGVLRWHDRLQGAWAFAI